MGRNFLAFALVLMLVMVQFEEGYGCKKAVKKVKKVFHKAKNVYKKYSPYVKPFVPLITGRQSNDRLSEAQLAERTGKM